MRGKFTLSNSNRLDTEYRLKKTFPQFFNSLGAPVLVNVRRNGVFITADRAPGTPRKTERLTIRRAERRVNPYSGKTEAYIDNLSALGEFSTFEDLLPRLAEIEREIENASA